MTTSGIYIHIPFCKSFCPYCDFYKVKADETLAEKYKKAVVRSTASFSNVYKDRLIDTIYFGGGTPSAIDASHIVDILNGIRSSFSVSPNCEITVECNPSSNLSEFLPTVASAGVNRISLGMQSAVDDERKGLGRMADAARVARAVELAKSCGISNISVDLMLGVPQQSLTSLDLSLEFLNSLDVTHVSAYMLKLEEGTNFKKRFDAGTLTLPSEDETVEFYNHTCDTLSSFGFAQYEISNFAKPGFESRHNLKYWTLGEYLGLGPAAHSFMDGKRFFFAPSLEEFLAGALPTPDGEGGDFAERVLLNLRLTRGLVGDIPDDFFEKASKLGLQKYLFVGEENGAKAVRLTREGFLVSNSIIGELLELI